jgi:hypothetical protein
MSATTAKRPKAIERNSRNILVDELLLVLGLEGVDSEDVLSVHVGTRSIGIRRKVRGRSGKVVPGHVLRTSHDVLPEPLED